MLELSQLRQLLKIADCKTLSGAAAQLYISQPALSRSLQRLEHDLGVELFTHGKNRIELNATGELALTYARQLVNLSEAMVTSLRQFHERQFRLCFAACAPAPIWELTALCAYSYPTMSISTEIIDKNKALLSGLLKREQDIVVLTCPAVNHAAHSDELQSVPFLRERLYVALPLKHPFTGKAELTFAELNGQSILLRRNLGFWQELVERTMPDSPLLPQQDDAAFNTIRNNSQLLSFISDIVLKREGQPQNHVCIPISDSEASITYYAYFLKEYPQRIEFLIEKLEKMRLF